MLKLLLVAIVLIGLAVVGLSIRILIKRKGQFSRRCSMSEMGEEMGVKHNCGHCDVPEDGEHEDCPRYQLHHGDVFTQTAKAIENIEKDEER